MTLLNLITMTGDQPVQPLVFAHHGIAYSNSLQVAEYFEKRHDHVLRDIREIAHKIGEINRFFVETTYVDEGGRTYPAYNMTRNGFALLAMGFTGDRAMGFKIALINEYERMEQQLRRSVPTATGPKISGALITSVQKLLMWSQKNLHLPDASLQTLASSMLGRIGIAMPEPVIPTQRYTTTTELATQYGYSPNMFGKMVKPLKTSDHGETRLTTASNGKQVEQFHWNDAGVAAIAELFSDGPRND